MKTITVNGTEYTLEYTFMAAEHKETVQKMFNVLSGAYMLKHITNAKEIKDNVSVAGVMLDGTSEMVAEIPNIVRIAFYSGLLENHKLSEEDAHNLMKEYMKENKISYKKLFDDIKHCMEDDGFFDLSGLTEMLTELNENMNEAPKKKKKSTSTK